MIYNECLFTVILHSSRDLTCIQILYSLSCHVNTQYHRQFSLHLLLLFEVGALLEVYITWTQFWPHCIIGSLNSNNPFSLTPSPRLVVTPFCPSSSPSILLFQSLLWSLLIYDPMRSRFLHFDCVNEHINQWGLGDLLQGTKKLIPGRSREHVWIQWFWNFYTTLTFENTLYKSHSIFYKPFCSPEAFSHRRRTVQWFYKCLLFLIWP